MSWGKLAIRMFGRALVGQCSTVTMVFELISLRGCFQRLTPLSRFPSIAKARSARDIAIPASHLGKTSD